MEPSLDDVLEKAARLQALVPGAVLAGVVDGQGSARGPRGEDDAMTPRFRNVDFDSTAPMAQWPAEAIETLIDRGTLSDWRRLAQAIRRQPWGPAARTAETAIGWGEHYGVDALMANVIADARAEVALRGRAEYAAQIRAWRKQTGMTLRQFAHAAGTSASRLSDYENAKVAPTTDVLGRLGHVAATHGTHRVCRDSCGGPSTKSPESGVRLERVATVKGGSCS